jgi:hypothetical protein
MLAVPALHKDGRRISIEFSIQLLKDADGQIDWVVAVVRDVTERFLREEPARSVEGRSGAVNRAALRSEHVMLAHRPTRLRVVWFSLALTTIGFRETAQIDPRTIGAGSTFGDFCFQADGCRKRRRHETGLLALFDDAERPLAVGARGNCQARAEDDFREACHAILSINGSERVQLEGRKFQLRQPGDRAQGEQKARLHGREQQVFRAPGIARTIVVGGRRGSELGKAQCGELRIPGRPSREMHVVSMR